MTKADELNANPLPYGKTLGIRFTHADPDRVVAELEVRPDLCTRHETAHGGLIMSFADTLGATGTMVDLDEGLATTTIESKTNFLAAVPVNTIMTGIATPIHKGRTTQIWQTRIETETGKLAALVTQTQLVIYPKG
ncbi:MAG: PaaI family thioesterase [Rhodospirillaceae bacterium]|nr:PaaI family thioesterase [Rhodospirillaceae bacterium]MBT3908845.1 PaaI family thioesterase [Rhodospirillaceae bacterium]MBT5299943.1 PaaI family thioesterase [Rhodospirillaceae bacterium]MBT5513105.1 PaaI family thioesterase [Rhodospirillaceae bacterium]MBT6087451.1 PaaI family thioesterase [Rhodospirillaceae bacterium]